MGIARIVIAVGIAAGIAHAQPRESGTSLFEEGRELARQGKYAEACERFARSYELDPATGTQLNFADCQEHLGNLGRAWQLFDLAGAKLDRENNPVRAQYARQRANVLVARLATLVVAVHGPDAHMRITIGGRDVMPASEIRIYVDPGEVEVVAVLPGGKRFATKAVLRASATANVEIPSLALREAQPEEPGRKRGWLIAAATAAGIGVAGIATSALLTLSASRAYSATFADGDCYHTFRGIECKPEGLDRVDAARSRAQLGTGVFIGGAVLVGAAAVLVIVAPRYEVAPVISEHAAGIAVARRF